MYMNKVVICGVDTSTLPLLKEAEKENLLKRVKQGDATARDELISGNLRLVLSVVQRFALRGENPDDLFQVGCIGLIKSIDNFDITQNVRFSTYAVPMIIECRETGREDCLLKSSDTYTTEFLREFARLKPCSQRDFDRRRCAGTPSWRTVARHNGLKSWNELVKKYDLAVYKKEPVCGNTVRFKVRVHTDI